MIKHIIGSEEAWQEFCKKYCIGNIQRTYNSQACNISGGKKSEFGFTCDGEWVTVPEEPIEYPCIFTYYQDCDDYQNGIFIYESDFVNIYKEK